jgi:hypothetical protein
MLPRMLTFGMTGDGGFDPLVLLLMALLVEAYIGEARRVFKIVRHPVKIIGDVIAFSNASSTAKAAVRPTAPSAAPWWRCSFVGRRLPSAGGCPG